MKSLRTFFLLRPMSLRWRGMKKKGSVKKTRRKLGTVPENDQKVKLFRSEL